MSEVLLAGVGAAAISVSGQVIMWLLNRKTGTSKRIEVLETVSRVDLQDRIKHIARAYIAAGELGFEEREDLHVLHDAYKSLPRSNGDLDHIMAQIDSLPIKNRSAVHSRN